jgi:NAD(P)-dependent dehydrogenase (short-subunit alcohol dehydrogenase family)
MERLDGKVAVVTGGASGIGRAMAERFVAEGMAVVVADVEQPVLDSTAEALRKAGGEVLAVPTDVRDPSSVEALAHAARQRFGTFHVVCNNAGVSGHLGRVWETPLEDWRWVLEVNLWGVINGIRSFVPTLVAQGEGHVVNTASMSAWSALPTLGAYAASKHAILAISEALGRELDLTESGVGVSVLCPGMVNSNIMTSERNWPAALGIEPPLPTDAVSEALRKTLTDGTTSGPVEPSAAAAVVVEGILSNRFVLSTHPDDVRGAAEQRLELARGGKLQPRGASRTDSS